MAWISSTVLFTDEELMQNNAREVYLQLIAIEEPDESSDWDNPKWIKMWTLNAIAGLLGNMEVESTINPGVWQHGMTGNLNVGFGLVQWTPASNYTNWADEYGITWNDGYYQVHWIHYETERQGQWIQTSEYPLTFKQFRQSTESPEYLASCFLKNFERAGVEVEDERREYARKWYDYLKDLYGDDSEPEPDTPSNIKYKKSHYKFFLFNRQRRRTR